jgi:hypothetical protein
LSCCDAADIVGTAAAAAAVAIAIATTHAAAAVSGAATAAVSAVADAVYASTVAALLLCSCVLRRSVFEPVVQLYVPTAHNLPLLICTVSLLYTAV